MAFEKIKGGIRKVQEYGERVDRRAEEFLEQRKKKDLERRKEKITKLEEKRDAMKERAGLITKERQLRKDISKSREDIYGPTASKAMGGVFVRPTGFRNEPPIYQGLGLFSEPQLEKRKGSKVKKAREKGQVKLIVYQGVKPKKKKQPQKQARREGYPTDMNFDLKF